MAHMTEAPPLQVFKAKLTRRGTIIDEAGAIEYLSQRGYGEKLDAGKLRLYDYETLYLMYTGRLEVEKGSKKLTLEEMVDVALRRDDDAWIKFLVYRDLRSRSYVVREGFGFGIDFRVYEKGEYGEKPAKYVVFCLSEGSTMRARQIQRAVQQIMTMGKEPVIAVVERRGEVIYYKVNPTFRSAR